MKNNTVTFDEVKSDRVYSSIIRMIRRIEDLNLKPELRERTLNNLRRDLKNAISEIADKEDTESFFALSGVGTCDEDSSLNTFDSSSLANTSLSNIVMCENEIRELDFDKNFNIWRIMVYFEKALGTNFVTECWNKCNAPEAVRNVGVRYESLLLAVMQEYAYFYLDSIAPKTIEDLTDDERENDYLHAYMDYRESEYYGLTDFIYAYLSREKNV